MISLHVRKSKDGFVLMERDYPAQGISPFYSNLCKLSGSEAGALIASKLVGWWHPGESAPTPEGLSPSDLLSVRADASGRLRLFLSLGASDTRPQVHAMEVPGWDGVLASSAADPIKLANFLRNTGIGGVTPPEAKAA